MKEEQNRSLDDLLNNVDYKAMENYVPTAFSIKFIEFIKMVNGESGEENKTPLFHYVLLDNIVSHSSTLAVSFRGSAKSSLVEYMILYIAVFGKIDGFSDISVGMYVGDTMDNGVKNMRNNLEYRYNSSEFLRKFVPHVKFTDPEWEFCNADRHWLTFRGYGVTPLTLNTRLYTENGFTTIGECKIGDKIYGDDGKLATIVDKSCYHNVPVYRISLIDGRYIDVSENHINRVFRKYNSVNGYEYREIDITTKELLKLPIKLKGKAEYRLYIPNPKPIQYPKKDFPLDPYLLGLLLGDGYLRKDGSCRLTGNYNDIEFYKSVLRCDIGSDYIDTRGDSRTISILNISNKIREIGLLGKHCLDKFIPNIYKFGSVEQRLELVRGMMDTDGCISERVKTSKPYYITTSVQLANDMVDLIRSLGGKASVTAYQPNGNRITAYRVSIQINQHVFNLPRKRSIEKIDWKHNDINAIVSIDRIEDQPTQCIAIDNDSNLFIASDYVVTHNTGVRGFKKYGQRPQIAFLDDLMTDKNAESRTVTGDIENVIYKAVRQAMHPKKRRIVWIGTPFNKRDPLYKAAGTRSWSTVAFPICQSWPCTKNEFVGAWPDRFPYEVVKNEYITLKENGRVDAFNQELMLRILSGDERLIQDEDIIWFDRTQKMEQISQCNVYVTTDFATSETEKSDFSVISVWALDSKGVFNWIDGIVARQDMSKNVDDLFRFAKLYRPLATGIEISGQQKGFVSWLKREMVLRGEFFYLASDKASGEEGLRPTTSKLTRFNTVVPLFKARRIAFPKELKESRAMQEALDELTSVTPGGFKSQHDDFADTVSQLELIDYFIPEQIEVKKSSTRNVFEDTRYFRTPETFEYSNPYIV